MKIAVFWVVGPYSPLDVYRRFRGARCLHHQGALPMEAARTSETSVNFYQTTRRNNPEDIHLQGVMFLSGRVSMLNMAINRFLRYLVTLL
jgi:hypothetical protein